VRAQIRVAGWKEPQQQPVRGDLLGGAKVPYIHSAVLAVAPWMPLARSYAANARTRPRRRRQVSSSA